MSIKKFGLGALFTICLLLTTLAKADNAGITICNFSSDDSDAYTDINGYDLPPPMNGCKSYTWDYLLSVLPTPQSSIEISMGGGEKYSGQIASINIDVLSKKILSLKIDSRNVAYDVKQSANFFDISATSGK